MGLAPDGEDDIALRHWVKIHNLPDYRYAKLNKTTRMLSYTEAEYEAHLQDPGWTKSDTDRLFSLCRQYDLRFFVIHDRFNPNEPPRELIAAAPARVVEGLPQTQSARDSVSLSSSSGDVASPTSTAAATLTADYRSVEELKARYYGIQQSLLEARCVARGNDPAELKKVSPLFVEAYDGAHETMRRQQLELVLRRTPAQEHLLEKNGAEGKRLDAQIRKIKRQLQQLRKNPRSALGIARSRNSLSRRSQKRAAAGRQYGLAIPERPMAPIPPECTEPGMFPALDPGVSLRSSRPRVAPTIKSQRVYKQLETALLSSGIPYLKYLPFAVPTARVADAYDGLRTDMVTLIHLTRHVAEREKSRNRLQAELRAQNRSTNATLPSQRPVGAPVGTAPSTGNKRKATTHAGIPNAPIRSGNRAKRARR